MFAGIATSNDAGHQLLKMLLPGAIPICSDGRGWPVLSRSYIAISDDRIHSSSSIADRIACLSKIGIRSSRLRQRAFFRLIRSRSRKVSPK